MPKALPLATVVTTMVKNVHLPIINRIARHSDKQYLHIVANNVVMKVAANKRRKRDFVLSTTKKSSARGCQGNSAAMKTALSKLRRKVYVQGTTKRSLVQVHTVLNNAAMREGVTNKFRRRASVVGIIGRSSVWMVVQLIRGKRNAAARAVTR